MDKFSFAQNGAVVTRLPPGFRFQPTDEELVFQYLKCKIFSCPLPALIIIPEINVCDYDPWDLPGDLEQEMYFFSHKEARYRNGNRTKRTTNSGYWKAAGSDKKILSSTKNHEVGMKKTLVFYRGKPSLGLRTDWIMHEYRLVDEGIAACNFSQNSIDQTLDNWVLCRIFSKKGSIENNDVIIQRSSENKLLENVVDVMAQPRLFDFMMEYKTDDLGPVSSSSSTSSITQASSSGANHED
ncbi:hypothetical protein I3760_11G003100 [Carya illinoinensis]|uniref:NAC domain-containing protein n=1 Tax=Carya illinoinensis TaxID=32201 RepID=A0A8T1NWR6_CARIL|nr:NAC domain-containing protein 83-like [Carya illinoinensis]KAG2678467.1 hypothetical protein I3760_11G003100 [Carya illinoinensis]KAG6634885.1 hypothetical protein CIPAW_11G003200 [Carya illinoinensis]